MQGIPIKIQARFPGEHHEDPRAFVMENGNLFLSYCNFKRTTFGRQCFVTIDGALRASGPLSFEFGRQGKLLGSKHEGHEKNWIWFYHDGKLNFVYTFEPLRVLRFDPPRTLIELNEGKVAKPLWTFGEVRGGTPLTKVGNEYWSFFHSSTPHKKFLRRYHMGCIVQEANPPFRIKRISKAPILSASEHDPRNMGSPLVVFPCGAIYRDNEWLVTLGVNDHVCAWIKLPHHELVETLRLC